jgi:hypothetical protein
MEDYSFSLVIYKTKGERLKPWPNIGIEAETLRVAWTGCEEEYRTNQSRAKTQRRQVTTEIEKGFLCSLAAWREYNEGCVPTGGLSGTHRGVTLIREPLVLKKE